MLVSVLGVGFVLLWNSQLLKGENGNVVNDEILVGDVNNLENQNLIEKIPSSLDMVRNFLVCGMDESERLTDVIMIAQINFQKNTVNVLQIPRDSYVESGASSVTGKINSVYSSGDKSLTPINRVIKVVNEQYQLKIHHYVTVTINAFVKIIDAVGGVPIDLPQAIGNNKLGIIPAGKQILNGQQSEWLVRHRYTYFDQDIGRIKVQRLFFASAFKKVKDLGLKEITSVIPVVYGNITTDLSVSDMKKYISSAINIPMENVNIHIVPGEGINYQGQSVWSMHLSETTELLNTYFRPDGNAVPPSQLGIKQLANTGLYYENTNDDFHSLINGASPGQKKDAV